LTKHKTPPDSTTKSSDAAAWSLSFGLISSPRSANAAVSGLSNDRRWPATFWSKYHRGLISPTAAPHGMYSVTVKL